MSGLPKLTDRQDTARNRRLLDVLKREKFKERVRQDVANKAQAKRQAKLRAHGPPGMTKKAQKVANQPQAKSSKEPPKLDSPALADPRDAKSHAKTLTQAAATQPIHL